MVGCGRDEWVGKAGDKLSFKRLANKQTAILGSTHSNDLLRGLRKKGRMLVFGKYQVLPGELE